MGSSAQNHKNDPDANQPIAGSVCVHQWSIEPPNGPTSEGVCNLCGDSRDFNNSYEISSWDNRKKHNPKPGSPPEKASASKKPST
ncbi:MAG: hypothetical protein HQ478_06265 [Chloroflexi bacterium]|nr:hypothetical protein [Chloroflexota bacterium]